MARGPRLFSYVVKAIAELGDRTGSTLNTIVWKVREILKKNTPERQPRYMTMEVRKALNYGVREGILIYRSGKFRFPMRMGPAAVDSLEVCKAARRRRAAQRRNTKRRRPTRNKSYSTVSSRDTSESSRVTGSSRSTRYSSDTSADYSSTRSRSRRPTKRRYTSKNVRTRPSRKVTRRRRKPILKDSPKSNHKQSEDKASNASIENKADEEHNRCEPRTSKEHTNLSDVIEVTGKTSSTGGDLDKKYDSQDSSIEQRGELNNEYLEDIDSPDKKSKCKYSNDDISEDPGYIN